MAAFILPFIIGAIFILSPGIILAIGIFNRRDLVALAASPFVSLFLYASTSQICTNLGITCSWYLVFFLSIVISIILAAIFRLCSKLVTKKSINDTEKSDKAYASYQTGNNPESENTKLEGSITNRFSSLQKDWIEFALYPIIGIIIIFVFFFGNMDSPESLAAIYDDMFHMGVIQTFSETGKWSFINVTPLLSLDESIWSHPVNGFYPTAWHMICAMVSQACGSSAMLSANAVNGVFMGIVFPCSLFAFLKLIFKQDNLIICGAFISIAFVVFPWQLVLWGPLFSNLSSMSCMLGVCVFFLRIFKEHKGAFNAFKNIFMFVIGLIALALAQTNAIFSLALLLIPYVIYGASRIPYIIPINKHQRVASIACGAIATLAICWFWVFCRNLEFLSAVTNYIWPATKSLPMAIIGVLTSCFNGSTPPQVLLSFFILLGIIYLIKTKQNRWIIFAYGFSCIIFVVCATTEGEIKQILGGFWYTDRVRIAAMTAIFALPLASAGFAWALKLCIAAINKIRGSKKLSIKAQNITTVIIFIVCIIWIYAPVDPINRLAHFPSGFNKVSSAVAAVYGNGEGTPLDDKERAFLDEVKEITGDDLVLNVPDDGSAFAYPTDDINVYYRSPGSYDTEDENPDSTLIRHHLAEIAENDEVAEAVSRLGAKYLLILDLGKGPDNTTDFVYTHYLDWWDGMEAVNETTPGFELVLSKDDMRLYRIS